MLTIFIPSYNRRNDLSNALDSIFTAIDNSDYRNFIKVLVVDDYSSEDIEEVIAYHRRQGHLIDFRLHPEKCGVAEIAMFSCLQFIDTKFAWLIGNDDLIMPEAINYVFSFLLQGKSSLYLLNFIGKKDDGSEYFYYISKENSFEFPDGETLFMNFGFATATTTFPCLCFEVEPIKAIPVDLYYNISPIYSHTFAFFSAFRKLPCTFVPRPVVVFHHNEAQEEHDKLKGRNKVYKRTSYFHASLGYVRHLTNISELSTIPLSRLARYREDEIDKGSHLVRSKMSGFFAFGGSIAQLYYELVATLHGTRDIIYSSREDILEQQYFFDVINIPYLSRMFKFARKVYCSDEIPQIEKIYELARIQTLAERLAIKMTAREFSIARSDASLGLPFGFFRGIKYSNKPPI